MKENEKSRIETLRDQGWGARRIAKEVGVSENTVKSYIRRNSDETRCPVCGKRLISIPGHKAKKFCSDECRMTWWNSHRDKVSKKSHQTFTCACCGKEFTAPASFGRKYCSRDCYIEGRFRGGADHD